MTKLCRVFLLISCFPLNIAYSQQSVNVLIVYYSAQGHTQAMAEAVAKGARSVSGVSVKLLPVAEATTKDLLAAAAIIVGSPVYNANVAPEVQKFINNWPFEGAPLRDKIGAAMKSMLLMEENFHTWLNVKSPDEALSAEAISWFLKDCFAEKRSQ